MLTSPLSLTIGSVDYSLKKVNQDNFGSVYLDKGTTAGTEVKLTIRNTYEGVTNSPVPSNSAAIRRRQMQRTVIDLEVTKFDADGFPTIIQSYQHVRSARGSVVADAAAVAIALDNFVESNATALVSWES
jgi:hypothetical protein